MSREMPLDLEEGLRLILSRNPSLHTITPRNSISGRKNSLLGKLPVYPASTRV